MMRQIVFDLETTGFKFIEGHRIVEIGAVELDDGRPTGRTFHQYVNPGREVPEEAERVHGLSTEFLSDKLSFQHEKVAPAFLEFIQGAVLIAHNGINFDVPFLNAELQYHGLPVLANEVIDTLLLARKAFPGSPASLDALCSRFNIDTALRKRDGHGALLDSQLLAKVYLELTGGTQRGLNFANKSQSANQTKSEQRNFEPMKRPRPELLTPFEREAHKKFIAAIGENTIWAKSNFD